MVSKADKHCIDCGAKGVAERRRCKECAKRYNRERAKERNQRLGRHNFGQSICPICGEPMTLWTRTQAHHATCRPKTVEDYDKVKRTPSGRTIGRQTFFDNGIQLSKDYVVHHLDENPDNNVHENLIAITRSIHNGLHRHLQHQRSLFLKENSSNSENCWDTLRDHITTTYLETSGAKVIKICDIGQSAAEPLNSLTEHGEGSEAMHGEPK